MDGFRDKNEKKKNAGLKEQGPERAWMRLSLYIVTYLAVGRGRLTCLTSESYPVSGRHPLIHTRVP